MKISLRGYLAILWSLRESIKIAQDNLHKTAELCEHNYRFRMLQKAALLYADITMIDAWIGSDQFKQLHVDLTTKKLNPEMSVGDHLNLYKSEPKPIS